MDERVKRANKLVLDIAKGDIKALDCLFLEFGGLLFNMARKYLIDKAKAEDLLSDILLKLVKTAKQFKKGGNSLNWLFKSIRNGAINMNKQQNIIAVQDIEDCGNWEDVFSFEENCVNNILLAEALSILNEIEKDVIYKKYWEGLTVREIAVCINKSPSTAQRIIKTALLKMHNKIK